MACIMSGHAGMLAVWGGGLTAVSKGPQRRKYSEPRPRGSSGRLSPWPSAWVVPAGPNEGHPSVSPPPPPTWQPSSAGHLDASSEGQSPSPWGDGDWALCRCTVSLPGVLASPPAAHGLCPLLGQRARLLSLMVGRRWLSHALSWFRGAADPPGCSSVAGHSRRPPSVCPVELSS